MITCAHCKVQGLPNFSRRVMYTDLERVEAIVCLMCGHWLDSRPLKPPEEDVQDQRKTIPRTGGKKTGPKKKRETPVEVKTNKWGKPIRPCEDCGRERPIIGRGLCGGCYNRALKAEGKYTKVKPMRPCKACGRTMKIYGRGLCHTCLRKAMAQETAAAVEPIEPESRPAPLSSEQAKEVYTNPVDALCAAGGSDFVADLRNVLSEIEAGLIDKNIAYGDSALNPVRVFAKADPLEQINVRLDDKLSRLMRGQDAGEDTEADLLGYLILERVCQRRTA